LPVAAQPLHTLGGTNDLSVIQLTGVYFVPKDRLPLPDWKERISYLLWRMEQFHQRELDGQSKLRTTLYPEPVFSEFSTDAFRTGDQNVVFDKTRKELTARLHWPAEPREGFPILLVFSEINWRELDDFYRVRMMDGAPKPEGTIIHGRHFPGAESGGARAMYLREQGAGFGLISGDGWRVPYSGTDCVAYHEGVGHPIGLPHPEPMDNSVMGCGQYCGWLNEAWLKEQQKRALGWQPPAAKPERRADLFSVFTALPDPLAPRPGQPLRLRLKWPAGAEVQALNLKLQTDLLGPWVQVPVPLSGTPPEFIELGAFDRPTPVSYRCEVGLKDGQTNRLWGYFQVRPDERFVLAPPLARCDTAAPASAANSSEPIDLLKLIELPRDAVSGTWQWDHGILVSPKQYGARVQIPLAPPAEYAMTAVVEPTGDKNSLILGQVEDGNRFQVLLDFNTGNSGPLGALENVDGRNVGSNDTTFHGPVLASGRASTIVCTVRKGEVTVQVDGKTVIAWKGDPSRLSLADYWRTPNSQALFLGAYDCSYKIHRLLLTPLSGQSRRL
jgi:hypothetical protein